jgi:hypothetical protein
MFNRSLSLVQTLACNLCSFIISTRLSQVILLQFIDQVKSPGGANTFVDGFNVVKQFKKEQPRAFELMVSTPVLWQIIGTEKIYGDFRMTFSRPVIE